jgi:putative membrane protein
MNSPFYLFLIRWFVSSLGIWISASIFTQSITYGDRMRVIIIAGLLLAIVNSIIKPIVVILSLPAILFSLGLFMIVINGFMLVLVAWLYPNLEIASFSMAMLTGIIIGLVNFFVSTILEPR